MYNGNSQTSGLTSDTNNGSVLEALVSTAFNHLNSQESTIQAIEERLHKILNKSAPPSNNKDAPTPQPVDFAQMMHQEMYRLEFNNRKLEVLLNHISEII